MKKMSNSSLNVNFNKKMNHLLTYSFLIWMMSSTLLWSQKKEEIKPKTLRLAHTQMREGNKYYEKGSYADAEVNYKMSLATVPLNEKAIFNMGNAMIQQKRYKEAIHEFEQLAKMTKNKEIKTKAYYNSGNASMGLKEYQKAIEAYKNSLRINPNDEETRYNLALAQKFLKENPPKDNKDQKDDKNKDDKNKDKKDDKNKDNKNKDQKDNKNKDDKNKDNKDDPNKDKKDNKDSENKDEKEQESTSKPQPGKMSDQQMKQLLEAINNEEKKTQDKVNAQKVKTQSSKKEKDW